MKKVFLLILTLFLIFEIKGQDIIVKKSGEVINCKIIDTNAVQVSYKIELDKNTLYLGRSSVKELKYEVKKEEPPVEEKSNQQTSSNNNTTYSHLQNNSNLQDVVYLKNGSVIRGIIVEQIPNKALKIQTYDNSLFVYEFDEIEKITKEINPNQKVEKEKEPEKKELAKNFKSKGFNSNLDFGIFANGSGISYPVRITIGGYLSRAIQLGFGTGVDFYSDPWIPFYLDLRINVLPYRVTPQFIINGGYSMDLKKTDFQKYINGYNGPFLYTYDSGYLHGFYFSAGVGVKIFFPNNKTAISFTVGDNLQQARYKELEKIYVNNFYAKIGFQF